jgi:hypothetical protein
MLFCVCLCCSRLWYHGTLAARGSGAFATCRTPRYVESHTRGVALPVHCSQQWLVGCLAAPRRRLAIQETYLLAIDDEKQQIVVRTTNKKYFKRLEVPMMRRQSLPLHPAFLSFDHSMNTLVIQVRTARLASARTQSNLRRGS